MDKKEEITEKTERLTENTKVVDETKQEIQPVKTQKEEILSKAKVSNVTKSEVSTQSGSPGEKEVLAEQPLVKEVAPEDFNWDVFDEKEELYSPEKRAELEALYDETLSTISENEIAEGKVVSITNREVVINIGYKSEGIISINEFRYNTDLKIGDKVEVFIENQEDNNGQLIISHKKARSLRSWDRVNKALETNEIIEGYIKCRTKGGMIVDVFGIEAFLPGSQIDIKPIRDYDIYVDKTMDFKVVKINREFKNVVVSHKALIEAELEEQKKEIIAKLEKGQVLEGTVKNITSYGVFIDLGGVDGLIHITDLSWGRIVHPEEVVKLDEKINVVILDFDNEKKRIALGLKQLTPHPWDALDEKLKIGDKIKGKVVVIADYGAFVEIVPGVEGLIHVSEMSWSQHLRSAQEFLKVGDEIEVQILTIDREERKLSLGIKQLKSDPWEKIDKKYSVNSKHTATVRNFTGFGIFVELEEGVDGLIHISDLSWTKKINHPSEFTSVGEKIDITVLEVDKENRRLSLGHKQLEENPWDVFETVFTIDSIHEGTIIEITEKGAVIALPYGVEGFSTTKNLVKKDASSAKVDEKLKFKIIKFLKEEKKIIVSHNKTYEDIKTAGSPAAPEEKTDKKKTKATTTKKTTLGDVGDKLAKVKAELEKSKPTPTKSEAVTKKSEPIKKISPKKSGTVSKKSETVPKKTVSASKKSETVPKKTVSASKKSGIVPEKTVSASKKSETVPKKTVSASKKSEIVPKKTVSASKKSGIVPKKTVYASKKSETVPKKTVYASKK